MSVKLYGLDSSLIHDAKPTDGFAIDVVRFSDYAELEKKYEALVAENAALKHAIEFATAPDMWEEHGKLLEYKYVDWYVDELNKALNTPATDAEINEIKAQGVDAFAVFLKEQAKESLNRGDDYVADRLNAQSVTAIRFAASLRGGE